MTDQPDDAFTFSDIIRNLMQLGVDAHTIDHVVRYAARDRWYAQRDAIVANDTDIAPTALRFAAELEEHCDRTHGINVAMIGLRELLGDEACVSGTHQLTIDLAAHAQRLKKLYGSLFPQIGMN